MQKRVIATFVAILFIFVMHAATAYALEFTGPLVSTDFVAKNLKIIRNADQMKMRLVEIGIDEKAYKAGHIPGAVFLKGYGLDSPIYDTQSDHMVVGHGDMETLMKKLGVGKDTHIIIYARENIVFATRFYWTLKYWKIPNIYLMDGTIAKWKNENREITTEIPVIKGMPYSVSYPPSQKIRARLTPEVFHAMMEPEKFMIVDSRPAPYYTGEKHSTDKWARSGHIPRAVNLPSPEDTNNKDDSFKTKNELESMAGKVGITKDKFTIAYCDTGVRSTGLWFVLSEILGYENVSSYDGSMREYSNRLDLPMEPGNLYKDFPIKK